MSVQADNDVKAHNWLIDHQTPMNVILARHRLTLWFKLIVTSSSAIWSALLTLEGGSVFVCNVMAMKDKKVAPISGWRTAGPIGSQLRAHNQMVQWANDNVCRSADAHWLATAAPPRLDDYCYDF